MIGMADRFGTVPALLLDGRRVKTNYEIARFLEELRPDPPLFPSEVDQRREVEEAERWGDEVFQMTARRLALAAPVRGPGALINGGEGGRLGPLLWRQRTVRMVATRVFGRLFGANAQAEQEMLVSLPSMLDRIDGWIETGVLNGDQLNVADFVIAPSIALLCYRPDLRPEIERRPAMRLLERVLPDPSGASGSAESPTFSAAG